MEPETLNSKPSTLNPRNRNLRVVAGALAYCPEKNLIREVLKYGPLVLDSLSGTSGVHEGSPEPETLNPKP